jgi:response regulator RpfG family c-di-GMP phosphodiesterase
VLVVDNNVSSLLVFRRQLRLAPCLLETVRSVRMALAVVQARDVSFVVAEQLLPDGTGAELLAEIAAVYPQARRVLLADPADVPLQPIGANPHYRLFVRPFNMRELVSAILSAVEDVSASYVAASVVSRPAGVLSTVADTDGLTWDTAPNPQAAATLVMQAVPEMEPSTTAPRSSPVRPGDDTAPIPLDLSENTEPHDLGRPSGGRSGSMAVVVDPVRNALYGLMDWLEASVYAGPLEPLRGHGERVARLATALARELACPAEQVAAVEVAARLHDIGELLANAPLVWSAVGPDGQTPAPAVVRRHIDILDAFIQHTHLDGDVAAAIYHHHERWDGTGYPLDLAQEVIPQSARIIAVADSWDALAHGRAYRAPAGPPDLPEAQREAALRALAGTALDPSLVELFLHRRLYEQVADKVLTTMTP